MKEPTDLIVPGDEPIEVITPDQDPDMSMANLEHLENVAKGIDRFITAHQTITKAILKLAKPGDWVKFKQGEQWVGCLIGAGAERIAAPMGISFINWSKEKKSGTDEEGDYYWWWYTCTAKLGGREIRVEGRAGTRDKLFGKKDGEWKALSSINEGDLQTAARHNCMKEGVKVLLGIRNMPVNELEAAGIKLIDGGVEFKKKEVTEEDKKLQTELNEILLKVTGNDQAKAVTLLETLTTWTNKENKVVKGKKDYHEVTGRSLEITLHKAKDLLKKSEIPAETKSEQKPEPEKKAETPETKKPQTPAEYRNAIGALLVKWAGGDLTRAADKLEEITTWMVDGVVKAKGKRKCEDLTDKQLFTIYGKVEKLMEGIHV